MASVTLRVYLFLLVVAILAVGLLAAALSPALPYGDTARHLLPAAAAAAAFPAWILLRLHVAARNLVTSSVTRLARDRIPRRKDQTFLGFGFAWGVGHAQRFYRLMAQGFEPPAHVQHAIGGNPLMHGLSAISERALFIPNRKRTHHILVTGSPGEGKTRFLDLLLAQIVGQGDAVIILDPKGDERLMNMVRAAAIDCGRGDRFRLLAIPWPAASCAYNPIASWNSPSEIADRVMGIFPPSHGESEAYRGFQWAAVHAVAQALIVAGLPITVYRLMIYLREPAILLAELAKRRFPQIAGPTARDIAANYGPAVASKTIARSQEIEDLLWFAQLQPQYYGKMTGSLIPQLERLTGDYRREIISPEADELARREILSWEAVDRGRLILYAYLGSLHGDESAKALGKLMLLDFKSYVARRYSYATDTPAGRISLVVDEAHHLVSEPFLQILAEARGADIAVLLSTQTTSQFEEAFGSRAAVDEILTQHFAHVQFQSRNPHEAEDFSTLAGQREIAVVSESHQHEPAFWASGQAQVDDFRATHSVSVRLEERPLVPVTAITGLPTFHYFARMAGAVWKGRVPLLADPDLAYTREIRKGASAA